MNRLKLFLFLMLIISSAALFAMELTGGTLLSPPKAMPPFKLKATENKVFSQTQLQGSWSLLFFGFTQCQQVCPTTLFLLKQTYEQLKKEKQPLPQMIFISIDTDHDSAQQADHYAKSFNAQFKGLAGTEKEIKALTQSLGVLYMKIKQGSQETWDHSATLFLINPQGQVLAIFSPPYESKSLAKSIAKAMTVA